MDDSPFSIGRCTCALLSHGLHDACKCAFSSALFHLIHTPCKLLNEYCNLQSGHSLWLLCCAASHPTLFRSVIRSMHTVACILAIACGYCAVLCSVSSYPVQIWIQMHACCSLHSGHCLWWPLCMPMAEDHCACPRLKIIVHAQG